jgi:hypothetical protein
VETKLRPSPAGTAEQTQRKLDTVAGNRSWEIGQRPGNQLSNESNTAQGSDGGEVNSVQEIGRVPTFATAYSGFPVELSGVGVLHAVFLNESRARGCGWCPVQEIRIRGLKMMGATHRPLLTTQSKDEKAN